MCREQKDISLNPAHEAQIISYLKATNIEVGLLLNFGGKSELKRFVYDNPTTSLTLLGVISRSEATRNLRFLPAVEMTFLG